MFDVKLQRLGRIDSSVFARCSGLSCQGNFPCWARLDFAAEINPNFGYSFNGKEEINCITWPSPRSLDLDTSDD